MAVERVIEGLQIGTDMFMRQNIRNILKMIEALKQAVELADDNVKTTLKNYIDSVTTTLNDKLAQLQSELDEVRTLAEILTDAEKGQLEEILEKVLKTISQEGLLNRLCLTLPDGSNVSLLDFLRKMSTIPQVKSTSKVYDPNTNKIVTVKLVLVTDNGEREENMQLIETKDITDDSGNVVGRLYRYATNPEDGFYKIEYYVKSDVQLVNFLNQAYDFEYEVEETNPVITLEFEPCPYTDTVDEAIETAADINQDGTIGDTSTADTTTTDTSTTTTTDETGEDI